MIKKSVIKISGMHCNTCSLNIDWELEEEEGVKEVNTSYAKQETRITYDDKLISSEKIIEVIKKTGYSVAPNS